MLDEFFIPKILQLKKKQKPDSDNTDDSNDEETDDDGYQFVETVGVKNIFVDGNFVSFILYIPISYKCNTKDVRNIPCNFFKYFIYQGILF